MSKLRLLAISALAGCAITGTAVLLLCTGKVGSCGPVDAIATIGYLLLALPALPMIELVGFLDFSDALYEGLSNPFGMAVVAVLTYTAVIFLVLMIARKIRAVRRRTGQRAAPLPRDLQAGHSEGEH
jgi:hypothetical protein